MSFDTTLNLGNCISFVVLILALLKVNKDNVALLVTIQNTIKSHGEKLEEIGETFENVNKKAEEHSGRIRIVETNVAVLNSTVARKGPIR